MEELDELRSHSMSFATEFSSKYYNIVLQLVMSFLFLSEFSGHSDNWVGIHELDANVNRKKNPGFEPRNIRFEQCEELVRPLGHRAHIQNCSEEAFVTYVNGSHSVIFTLILNTPRLSDAV